MGMFEDYFYGLLENDPNAVSGVGTSVFGGPNTADGPGGGVQNIYLDWNSNPITAEEYQNLIASYDVAGDGTSVYGGPNTPSGPGGGAGVYVAPESQSVWDSAWRTAQQTGQDINNVLKSWGITSGIGGLLTGAANIGGSLLSGDAATKALNQQAQTQLDVAKLQAEMSKFRPVGVTTRFGASNYGYDPATGNLVSAGYTLSPELLAQQNALMALSNQGLTQAGAAPAATAPMGTAANRMMTLGNQYLTSSPQEQAAKYMAEQQALLAPYRERELSQLQSQLQAQGRLGLATGGTTDGTMAAANPQLEAYYNAKRMQDLQLASQATLGGQQYATYGAGLVGSGGNMMRDMYGTQTAAYNPYQTALGSAQTVEGLGQQPLDIGVNIGARGTAASQQAGMLLGSGMNAAANTQATANAYSPWGAALSGVGTALGNMQAQQAQNQQNQQLLTLLGGKGY
jgi:hypothetical protein